jgi:hypothetical protein
VLSEALDKLLATAAKEHELLAAVLADSVGLLVASAKDDGEAERVGAVTGLLTSLKEVLADHKVLSGLKEATLSGPGGQHLLAWSVEVEGEEMLLALLVRGPRPGQELADHLVEGVGRIFSTYRG